jgi:hypothetical protein
MRVVGISLGPSGHSRDMVRKAGGGGHLDQVTQIRRFSRWSGWGGWSLWLDAKSHKTSSRDNQDCVYSGQMFFVIARREAGPCQRKPNSKAALSQAKTKGNYQAQVHSGQMVLMVGRREAGPVAWWPKMLKWELENNQATKGLNWTKAKWQPKMRVNLLFLRGRWRRELLMMMMIMSENQSS